MVSVPLAAMATILSAPVLEPDLHRAFRHVDLLGYSLSYVRGGRGVLVELHLQGGQLVLRRPLALLVLLLLCQGALPRRSTGCRAVGRSRHGGRGWGGRRSRLHLLECLHGGG